MLIERVGWLVAELAKPQIAKSRGITAFCRFPPTKFIPKRHHDPNERLFDPLVGTNHNRTVKLGERRPTVYGLSLPVHLSCAVVRAQSAASL
jgi:hypothetical protein